MNKNRVEELVDSWVNGNKSFVYGEWLELEPAEKAYFVYYLDDNEQERFCHYCELKGAK